MLPRTAIPKGVRVFPPAEAARRRAVEAALFSVFRRWGFQEVILPTFEYLEVFEQPAGQAGDQIFKFVDRETGRLLALRVDLTPQVARMAATTLRHAPLPLRLAYAADVFRCHEPRAGRQREFRQVGVELLGLEAAEADAEMIAMAVEGCQAAGLRAFQIDVGQVEIVRGVLEALQPPPSLRAQILCALRRKDPLELASLLAECPGDRKLVETLEALPRLYGGRSVLDEAAGLSLPAASRRALANLAEIVTILENYGLAEHVILDLAEAHAFEYCTGVVFGAFARGMGYQISNGGRYDTLVGQFGYACPATGFSFDLDRVMAALEAAAALPDVAGPDVLLIDFSPDKRAAHRLARALRARGLAVARDIIRRELQQSLAYGRAVGIRRAVILGAADRPPGSALIVDLASGAERVVPREAFEQAIADGSALWPEEDELDAPKKREEPWLT
jgi:ATP phosphoribosyltransferase regulatory subunit